jgi:hypothetical protein
MGHQIIEQPDGKLCVFSTVVDGFVFTDATEVELLDYYAEQAASEARERIKKIIGYVREGRPEQAYYQFALTYEEAQVLDRYREDGYWEDAED